MVLSANQRVLTSSIPVPKLRMAINFSPRSDRQPHRVPLQGVQVVSHGVPHVGGHVAEPHHPEDVGLAAGPQRRPAGLRYAPRGDHGHLNHSGGAEGGQRAGCRLSGKDFSVGIGVPVVWSVWDNGARMSKAGKVLID